VISAELYFPLKSEKEGINKAIIATMNKAIKGAAFDALIFFISINF
jgi:hypothetical protein